MKINWMMVTIGTVSSMALLGSLPILVLGIHDRFTYRLNKPGPILTSKGELRTGCGTADAYLDTINEAGKQYVLSSSLIAATLEGMEKHASTAVDERQGVMHLSEEMFTQARSQELTLKGTAATGDDSSDTRSITAAHDAAGSELPDDLTNARSSIYAASHFLRAMTLEVGAEDKVLATYHTTPSIVIDKYKGDIPPFVNTHTFVDDVLKTIKPRYDKCLEEVESLVDGTKIYLHWTAGGYDTSSTNYTYNILRNGKVLTTGGRKHTLGRDDDSFGISIAAMHNGTTGCYTDILGSKCPTPIQQAQLDTMIKLAAELAIKHDIPVDSKHIMTHGEAAGLRDFPPEIGQQMSTLCHGSNFSHDEAGNRALKQCPAEHGFTDVPHGNYGPTIWGGDGSRWEYFGFEDELRSRIANKVAELQAAGSDE